VVPALALARALAAERGSGSVELVGARRGIDQELVAGSGLPLTLLPGRGIVRSIGLKGLVLNVRAIAELALALILAGSLVVRRRPEVVVAIGGYACVPTAMAAWALGVPVVLVNVDAVAGSANRLVGRIAKAAAVAFDSTRLPRAVVTGAPVREEIVGSAHPSQMARERARSKLGIPPGRRVVGAVGGSLGARRINEAVVGLATQWVERDDLALYHVVGRRDLAWTKKARETSAGPVSGGLWYEQVAFEEQMGLFYQACDVVVCRAGANTIAELTVVGVPAVVVPLPRSPGGHQSANAKVLQEAKAAVVVDDFECDGGRLATQLETLLGDDGLLAKMRAASASLGRPDALASVTALVEQVGGGKEVQGPQHRKRGSHRHSHLRSHLGSHPRGHLVANRLARSDEVAS
jgi:UDP-N-acetylglucosamine--N-acetylmuramyl-(pentapeptide) pyrophosphoryl-undecaprenol N-acetylglucosamine transferase